MSGAVIENLSNRKLFVILSLLSLALLGFFLIGGLIAPSPSTAMPHLMTKCEDLDLGTTGEWFYLRGGPNNLTASNCKKIEDMGSGSSPYHLETGDPRELVFVAQMPHMKDNIVLEYSPWFQSILGLLVVDTHFYGSKKHLVWNMAKDASLKLEVRMGFQKRGDPPGHWRELTRTVISRRLDCSIQEEHKMDGYSWDCVPMELFELGSSDYPFYLLNIRIPICNRTGHNCRIGRLMDLSAITIHQNGGFTKVWLSMKTFLTPLIIWAVFWYWNRFKRLVRQPYLVEKAVLVLGITMSLLDFPFEWLSLWVRLPFMLLLSDIRQGLFYAVLFSFLLIFTGEHATGDSSKNTLSRYWKHLTAVICACLCMFVFDMCERGVHLRDPFYSIWATDLGTHLAYTFIVLTCLSVGIYFLVLAALIYRVLATIKRKRSNLLSMNLNRRLQVQGIIYRFKFLMILTLVCAGLTVAGFMMEQVGEGQLRWGDYEESPFINSTSAFLTGVFGMWNLYVLLLLAMYAPSHKQYRQAQPVPELDGDEENEDILLDESTAGPSESTEGAAMTSFIKQAED